MLYFKSIVSYHILKWNGKKPWTPLSESIFTGLEQSIYYISSSCVLEPDGTNSGVTTVCIPASSEFSDLLLWDWLFCEYSYHGNWHILQTIRALCSREPSYQQDTGFHLCTSYKQRWIIGYYLNKSLPVSVLLSI